MISNSTGSLVKEKPVFECVWFTSEVCDISTVLSKVTAGILLTLHRIWDIFQPQYSDKSIFKDFF